jgi:LysM repeat protein
MTRPNRPGRLVARLAGVTAMLALGAGATLVTAGPAAAAGTVWDEVAACESGGRWPLSTGNGYYGGLQFSSSTWRAYGGRAYAKQASGASKAEQIRVARRVLAAQGPGAWPTCGRRAELTRSNGRAATSTPAPSRPTAVPAGTATAASPRANRSAVRPALTRTVTVQPGDTLARIARREQVPGGWQGLWALNSATVPDPDQIGVGQTLRVS